MSARRYAGAVWAFRRDVEHEATARFEQLAERIERHDPGSGLTAQAQRAAEDERRHAALCEKLARDFEVEPGMAQSELTPLAPRRLDERDALLYDLVAQCCIAESESTATLLTLLESRPIAPVREVLHSLAKDEVRHAQLGWTFVAQESSRRNISFLSSLVPSMVAGTARTLFDPKADEPEALELGVFTHQQKKDVFLTTMREVVLPGLAHFGIDVRPTEAWLSQLQPGQTKGSARLT